MTATILDGRALAAALRERLSDEAAHFAERRGRRARIALVAAGEDPTAALYAGQVVRSCLRVGLDSTVRSFAGDVREE
ncbi:MAG TPA: tetrahydrofolate dehydrogenase/cyclohydrolase catalytic domain-containing protein, partial [Steroidobacteraceae bacterium]|nr:tetrahydrofolate dehydrogenase/cyclohydrolase catalytic domain-containing protein [Steroidobacteraceae bacterium]